MRDNNLPHPVWSVVEVLGENESRTELNLIDVLLTIQFK